MQPPSAEKGVTTRAMDTANSRRASARTLRIMTSYSMYAALYRQCRRARYALTYETLVSLTSARPRLVRYRADLLIVSYRPSSDRFALLRGGPYLRDRAANMGSSPTMPTASPRPQPRHGRAYSERRPRCAGPRRIVRVVRVGGQAPSGSLCPTKRNRHVQVVCR